MLIQPIQNQQNNTSFKSVIIFKEHCPVRTYKMGISIVNDGLKGMTKVVDKNADINAVLGHSKDAVTLENMLKKLGNRILNDENVSQVRELMKNVRERFKPEVEGWFEGTVKGMKKMLTQESLDSLDRAIKTGKPVYIEQDFCENTPRILSLHDLEQGK